MRNKTMSQVMTIAAIRATFPDEWVAVAVTTVDNADVPVSGVVLTHSQEKAAVYQAMQVYRQHHPAVRLFIFFTGEPIPADVGVTLAVR